MLFFSINSSPSMRDNDPTDLRLNSSKSFVEKLNSTSDRAAIVSWGGKLGFKTDLISDFSVLKSDLDSNISIEVDPIQSVSLRQTQIIT